MEYTKEFDLYTFKFWGGAKGTIEEVQLLDMMDELESLLEDVFYESTPSATDINDFVWFEDEMIQEYLGVRFYEN